MYEICWQSEMVMQDEGYVYSEAQLTLHGKENWFTIIVDFRGGFLVTDIWSMDSTKSEKQ